MTCFQLIIYTIDAEFVYRFLNHQTEWSTHTKPSSSGEDYFKILEAYF